MGRRIGDTGGWKIAFTGGKWRQLLVAALRSWLGTECGLNAKNAC
jgi:hypothetical protein